MIKLSDIISPHYMIGCTVGVVIGYAWHRWSFSDASLVDTIILAIASEAFILLWSILLLGKWKQ